MKAIHVLVATNANTSKTIETLDLVPAGGCALFVTDDLFSVLITCCIIQFEVVLFKLAF